MSSLLSFLLVGDLSEYWHLARKETNLKILELWKEASCPYCYTFFIPEKYIRECIGDFAKEKLQDLEPIRSG